MSSVFIKVEGLHAKMELFPMEEAELKIKPVKSVSATSRMNFKDFITLTSSARRASWLEFPRENETGTYQEQVSISHVPQVLPINA